MLEVVRTQIGVITYLVPTGPFNGEDELRIIDKTVQACMAEREVNLVVDLSKIPTITGIALDFFLDIQDKLASLGGSFKVVNANALLKDIFTITGVGDYIAVIDVE